MKTISLFILLSLLSCQKEESKPQTATQPEKVASIEDEIGSFTFVSNIQGIQIKGDRISRSGELTLGEDLRIIETSTSKVIDDFPMKDWGKVGFKVEPEIVHVYPLKDYFEIVYSVKEKKIIRKPSCNFNKIPEDSKYNSLIEESKKTNPDWESISGGLADLAKQGHKKSYDFFISPDETAKTILKNTEDAGASIIKVLKFMSKNGCKWL